MRGVKLNKRVCLELEPEDANREEFYWDAGRTGLGVRVTERRGDGRRGRYFVFGYTTKPRPGADGRPRQPRWRVYQLGSVGRWTLQQAQDEVIRLNALVNAGGDPVQDRRKQRHEALQAKTVSDLAVLMLERHHGSTWEEPPPVGRRKTESKYAREDRQRWRRWVLPSLGSLLVAEVTTDHVDQLLGDVSEQAGTTAANRLRSMLSVAFNKAEVWKLRPQKSNPVSHALKHSEQRRQRILSREELITVLDVLDELLHEAREPRNSPQAVRQSLSQQRQLLAIQLAAETMRRPDEVFRLRWSWVDFDERVIRLPKSKADRKGQVAVGQSFGLSGQAIGILQEARKLSVGSPFVFPSVRSDGRGHFSTVRRMWTRVLKRASIEDRPDLYSLKHTYISLSDEAGVELGGIRDQAGHGDIRTTELYRRGDDERKVATATALSRYVQGLRSRVR